MTREWPVPPDPERTLHLIGDVHAGAIVDGRLDAIVADVTGPLMPDAPAAHVQLGDCTDNGIPSEDTDALAFFNGLTAATGAPWVTCMGNHDVFNNTRTPNEWAAAYGYDAPRFTVEYDWCKLIALSANNQGRTLSDFTLNFLDTELGNTNKPCFVLCHFPLYNTVLGDDTKFFVSTEANFFALGPNSTDDTQIRAVLADHGTAKAWLSGHTHSPLTAPGLVKEETVGARTMAHINAGAPMYTGRVRSYIWYPFWTAYMTSYNDGNLLEVRFRDHGAGVWTGSGTSGTERVQTVDLS